MYRFLILANTAPSEQLQLIGGATAVGGWELPKAIAMLPASEAADDLGLRQWTARVNLSDHGYRYFEYKYVKVKEDGAVEWEDTPFNRNVMAVPGVDYEVDDGVYGRLPPLPPDMPGPRGPPIPAPRPGGLRVAVCGSSVVAGFYAEEDQGWVWQLAKTLEAQFGHQTINVGVHGYDTMRLLNDFQRLVASQKPDIVVISLSLANEGLSWKEEDEWDAVAASFKKGIRQLLLEVEKIGATPVLGGVYPNGNYEHPKQLLLLQEAHDFCANLPVPMLDWLGALHDGQGRWLDGLMRDASHPNSAGHHKMFDAIDTAIFDPSKRRSLLP